MKAELEKANCDIVLLIGWMRILSDEFVDFFRGNNNKNHNNNNNKILFC